MTDATNSANASQTPGPKSQSDEARQQEELRQTQRALERALDEGYRQDASRRICERIVAQPLWQDAPRVACFVDEDGGVDTTPLLENALKTGKVLAVATRGDEGQVELRQVTDMSQIVISEDGTRSPSKDASVVDPSSIFLAIIPCLAFDRWGNRLDAGDGAWTDFLHEFRAFSLMVGLDRMMVGQVPMDDGDLAVGTTVTEQGFWRQGFIAQEP